MFLFCQRAQTWQQEGQGLLTMKTPRPPKNPLSSACGQGKCELSRAIRRRGVLVKQGGGRAHLLHEAQRHEQVLREHDVSVDVAEERRALLARLGLRTRQRHVSARQRRRASGQARSSTRVHRAAAPRRVSARRAERSASLRAGSGPELGSRARSWARDRTEPCVSRRTCMVFMIPRKVGKPMLVLPRATDGGKKDGAAYH